MNILVSVVNILQEERKREKMMSLQFLHGQRPYKTRAPPKERSNPVTVSNFSHSVEIIVELHPDNHVSTCTRELVKITTEDIEVEAKPAVCSAGYNTAVKFFFDAPTNTEQVQTNDASTQMELLVVESCDASTQTDCEDENLSTPFRIEQIQDNCNAVKFYTGFPSFQLLLACLMFLGPAMSNLSYEDHVKLRKGKQHKLSPMNEFF